MAQQHRRHGESIASDQPLSGCGGDVPVCDGVDHSLTTNGRLHLYQLQRPKDGYKQLQTGDGPGESLWASELESVPSRVTNGMDTRSRSRCTRGTAASGLHKNSNREVNLQFRAIVKDRDTLRQKVKDHQQERSKLMRQLAATKSALLGAELRCSAAFRSRTRSIEQPQLSCTSLADLEKQIGDLKLKYEVFR